MINRIIPKTDIEQIMYDSLKKLNINFSFQYPIRCKYGYIGDFYLPEYNLIIECDGEIWHNDLKNHKKNIILKRLGYKILRFKGKEIRKNINLCLIKLQEVIKNSKN